MKKILSLCLFLLSTLSLNADRPKPNIGLCIMATGRYNVYAEQFMESCRKHFFKGHQVTYFVFTDNEIREAPDVVKVYQKRLGWPYDTLMRFEVYEKHKDLYKEIDYIFASDADMLFVADVGEEMLGELVGTQHPGYVGQRGTYEEKNPRSTAFVRRNEGKMYFAGGFYGGKKEAVLKLWQTTTANIHKDLQKNFIAVWHDESHLNRYFIDHPPKVILSPSYCYPESWPSTYWKIPYPKKLLALDKDHDAMRQI